MVAFLVSEISQHAPSRNDSLVCNEWCNSTVLSLTVTTIMLGCLQSLDWTSGLDWWTGLVDWTGGLTFLC